MTSRGESSSRGRCGKDGCPLETKKARKSSETFIAIHLGAGDHNLSEERRKVIKGLCKTVCQEAMKLLLSGKSADDAVTLATTLLEDSGLLNAGVGSSLTIDGACEGDAGFMSGDGPFFGGVGAVPDVRNPILLARKIADMHRDQPLLSCGRIPPLYLVGPGAKQWGASNSVPGCGNDETHFHLPGHVQRTYKKYMERVKAAKETSDNQPTSPNNEAGMLEDSLDNLSDTVGAIALDKMGNVASSVSSGGNWLKHSGRIGHSPMFGCGCWASNGSEKDDVSIAISCSGAGEMLAKIHLPQQIARSYKCGDNFGLVPVVSKIISDEFLENPILHYHREVKNLGVIAFVWDGAAGEFVWGHTSKNFIVAHLASSSAKTKVQFQELPVGRTAGASVQLNGLFF